MAISTHAQITLLSSQNIHCFRLALGRLRFAMSRPLYIKNIAIATFIEHTAVFVNTALSFYIIFEFQFQLQLIHVFIISIPLSAVHVKQTRSFRWDVPLRDSRGISQSCFGNWKLVVFLFHSNIFPDLFPVAQVGQFCFLDVTICTFLSYFPAKT